MNSHSSKYHRSNKITAAAEQLDILCVEDLLKNNLRSLYFAEKTLARAYHQFMKTAHCEDLQDHFFASQQSCKTRMQRLENILGRMGEVEIVQAGHSITDAMVQKALEICEQPDGSLRDISIICCALEGENYLLGSYKNATEFCETLGQYKMGELLDTSLNEKENAAAELSELLKTWLEKTHGEEEQSSSSANLIHQ